MTGEIVLLISVIWCLKVLLAKILTIVKDSKFYSWSIEFWNCLNSVYNNVNLEI